jgi:hypothetical protein
MASGNSDTLAALASTAADDGPADDFRVKRTKAPAD